MGLTQTRSVNPHGFLYLRDPPVPIPIPHHTHTHERGYGFLAGTGTGRGQVIRGLPVTSTISLWASPVGFPPLCGQLHWGSQHFWNSPLGFPFPYGQLQWDSQHSWNSPLGFPFSTGHHLWESHCLVCHSNGTPIIHGIAQ